MWHEGAWASVTSINYFLIPPTTYFTDVEASVVCRQLGFGRKGTAYPSATFGKGAGAALNGVVCTGTEARLEDCWSKGFTAEANHAYDAGVSCEPKPRPISLGA